MIVEPVESAEVMVDSFLGSESMFGGMPQAIHCCPNQPEFRGARMAKSLHKAPLSSLAGCVFGLLLTIGMHPQENSGHIVFAQKFCGDRAGIAVEQLEVVWRKDFNSSPTMPRTPAKNSRRLTSDVT